MSALSDYLENVLLNHQFRNTAYTPPTTLYVSLHTIDPGESGVGGEIVSNGYTRALIANNSTNFPACSLTGAATKLNATTISFPTASAAWGLITHWAIYDHPTNTTNMLAHGPLFASRSVTAGDTPRISSGFLTMTMNNSSGGGLTTSSKRKLLDHVFGAIIYTPPTTIYTGIGTALTDENLTEWADSSYTRMSTVFTAPAAGATENQFSVQYSGNVATPITITHLGVWDDATQGRLLAVGPLSISRGLTIGDTVDLQVGALDIALL